MLKRWIGFGWMGLCLFACLGLVAGCPSATGGGEGEGEPEECAAEGEACTANEDCCEGLVCGEDGTCVAEEEPPECAAEGEACTADEDCCEGLICGEDDTCVAEEEPPKCAVEGEACMADEDCCEGLVCGEDDTCVAEEEPPECAAEGEACDEDTPCCEGFECVDGVCAAALGDPAERFATSLHAEPRRGQQYFYETSGDGFYTLTDVPYDQLGCGVCHKNPLADGTEPTNDEYVPGCGDCHEDPADPTIPVAEAICLSCHSRQKNEQALLTDVHRDVAGLTCVSCHGDLDMHGDGTEYNSLLETRFVRCENCHIDGMNPDAPIVDPAHDGHGGDKLDCSACHVESVVTCYSCHFETEAVAKLGKRWFGQSVLSGYKMLVNYDGKVYPGTFMTLTFQGQTFLTIAPYYAHNVVAFDGPMNCGMCHRQSGAGNAAVEAYFNGEPIVVTQWLPDEEGTDRLAGPTGVIPVTPNWQTDLVFDFLDYTGDPADAIDGEVNLPLWDVITNGLDGSHMPFGSPLTDDQMNDLTQY